MDVCIDSMLEHGFNFVIHINISDRVRDAQYAIKHIKTEDPHYFLIECTLISSL